MAQRGDDDGELNVEQDPFDAAIKMFSSKKAWIVTGAVAALWGVAIIIAFVPIEALLFLGIVILAVGIFVIGWAVEDRGYHPDGTPKLTPMRQFWNWREARRLERREDTQSQTSHDRALELNEQAHRHAMGENRAQIDSVEYLEELRQDYGFKEVRFTSKVELKRQQRELARDYYKIDAEFRATSKKINAELLKSLLDFLSEMIQWYGSRKGGASVADRIEELKEIQEQVRRMRESGEYSAQDIRRVLDALMQDFARSRA